MLFKHYENNFSVPLNSKFMDSNAFFVSSMQSILVSYNDISIKNVSENLFYLIAENCDWCYPDIENSKIDFLVNCSVDKFKFDLIFTAVPPKYSFEDIDGIYVTHKIVDEANAFWNNKGYVCENTLVIPVKLTCKEENIFLRTIFSEFLIKKVG